MVTKRLARPAKRGVLRTLKFTTEEDRAVQAAAARAGVTFSAFVRELVLRACAPELSTGARVSGAVEP